MKTQPIDKIEAPSSQNTMKNLNEYLYVDHWIVKACKQGEPCLNTTSIVTRNSNTLPVELTDIDITNPSAWKITTPNAFPVRILAGETYIITKELTSSSIEPADGGLVTIKLNDGNIFTSQ